MGYRLFDVDVTRPLPELSPDEDRAGLGVLLRDGWRPLGFLLVGRSEVPLTGSALAQLAAQAGARGLLTERLYSGLLARTNDAPGAPPRALTVTVAVCTRNRPDDLALCLDSVLAATIAHPAEVLVVDNCPPDDRTRTVVSGFAGVRYVTEPVAGLDVARNRALAEARGEWIAFADDDVRVDRWWLDGLAAALLEHPDAAAVTGLVLPAELHTQAQLRFECRGGFGRGYQPQRWDGRHGPGNRLHPLGAGVFGAGCNMAFNVAVMRSLGGFDEALDTGPPLPGGGDLDAFYRVLDAGHVLVYEPRMAVFHRHRRGMDDLQRQYRSWGTGFAAYLGARWADPRERGQVMRMLLWWLRYQQRRVTAGVRQRDHHDVRMALAELSGGITGLPFGYLRSRGRMATRRARVASQSPGAGPDQTASS
jgi:glycosyltransferase involved in cell wall biosynthesis